MNDDLEHTRALNDLSDLIKKEENKNLATDELAEKTQVFNEETSEELYNSLVSKDDEETDIKVSQQDESPLPKKTSLKDKWHNLSKKKKIIICSIVAVIIVSLLVIGFILAFKKNNNKATQEDEVIVVKDNYIYKDGSLEMIDENNNPLGTYECHNKDANLCYVAYLNNSEDAFESPISQYEDGSIIKVRSSIYLKKYVFIVDQAESTSNVIYLYDMFNNNVIGEYLGVKAYDIDKSNYVILKNKSDNYGLVELTDNGINNIIDFKYNYLGIINKDSDDYIVAKNNKGSYLIDYKDNYKTKALDGSITDYNDENIIVKKNNKYFVYDYSAQEYLADYDYIRIVDASHFATVMDKNVYIKDLSGSKYNESGFVLNNDSYITVNTYGTDNKKISSKTAFSTEVNNNILTLNINSDASNDTYLINLNEGEASLKYSFYSYFDGKLYFYSDEAKTTVIGTYTCTNKNEIGDDRVFNNCYIAKDTVKNDTYVNPYVERNATIPIFNGRYIFVYDAPTLSNESNTEIKLYDLTQNKTLGTYSEIDSNTLDNKGTLTHVTTKGTDIIAKLKSSGNYGVLEITSNGCDVKYKFNYKALENYGKYYLAQNVNGKYQIIKSSDVTSYEFPGKIMNNNNDYFVIKNNDGVKIYKNINDPTPLLDKNFKYIDLKDAVFGAVDSNNNLWVFKYSDSTNPINTDTISLKSTSYYGSETPAFKLEISGNNLNIKIYNGTSYDTKTYSLVTTSTTTSSSSEKGAE